MKKIICLCLSACLLLSGCAFFNEGSYFSTTPHKAPEKPADNSSHQARDYAGLTSVLCDMVANGVEHGVINISQYSSDFFEKEMEKAVNTVLLGDPIAAYAVDTITWEQGTSTGQKAVSVSVSYIHDRTEIKKIQPAANMEKAAELIYQELNGFSTGIVLYIEQYSKTDIIQLVEEYGFHHPESMTETPQVTANIYPQWGVSRVLELKFTYQNAPDSLRIMQNQVQSIFSSAKLYVTGDTQDRQKFSQLYAFLMERFDYKYETSITPAYSLLSHGVGDSKAFATVFSAMCRSAQLDCQVVSGARQGQRWYWNLIRIDGSYYHLDLIQCNLSGGFQTYLDKQMTGYVWDYSAYPATPEPPPAESTPDPSTEPTALPAE